MAKNKPGIKEVFKGRDTNNLKNMGLSLGAFISNLTLNTLLQATTVPRLTLPCPALNLWGFTDYSLNNIVHRWQHFPVQGQKLSILSPTQWA